ncbi:MAG TPA: amidohydrolase family protein, partial [Bacillota bacterium]
AVLPLQDVTAAVAEVERVASLPALRGVVIPAKPLGQAIDDPRWEPLWAALDRAGMPISLHPEETVGGDDLGGHGSLLHLALGFPFETTTAAARLGAAGILERYPNLRWLLPHGGGTLPYLLGRLRHLGRVTSRPFPEEPRNLWYDALVYDPAVLPLLVAQAGSGNLVYGTDHPFAPPDPDRIHRVLRETDLAEADRQRIAHLNAERLFNLGQPG